MKLARFGEVGIEKPATVDASGQLRDLSSCITDISGKFLSDEGLASLRSIDVETLPKVSDSVRLGQCISGVGKFICVGLNYSDHAEEAGMALPDEPIIFMKATSAICGPNDPIIIPKMSQKTDWEVELAVIIGKRAKYVREQDALNYVAGYAVTNDVSERDFQLERFGQWTKGKSCDNFGQLGPWLVTRDEIQDPQNLGLWLKLNGKTMQNGSTKTMVFGVAHLVSYISRFMTLHPGDVISTGTPPGVGMGQPCQRFLRPGDRVELGIDGLGTQIQTVMDDFEVY